MDSMILGERLRQIRLQLGLTQRQLATATNLTQSVMSRLENGEEVYASVLLAVLRFYQGKVCLDTFFAPEFNAAKEKISYNRREEHRQKFIRHLDIIADAINEASVTSLAQIDRLKKDLL